MAPVVLVAVTTVIVIVGVLYPPSSWKLSEEPRGGPAIPVDFPDRFGTNAGFIPPQ